MNFEWYYIGPCPQETAKAKPQALCSPLNTQDSCPSTLQKQKAPRPCWVEGTEAARVWLIAFSRHLWTTEQTAVSRGWRRNSVGEKSKNRLVNKTGQTLRPAAEEM